MKNSCENCLHKGICKLEESFEYFKKDLLSKPGNENFEVEFRCKKFLDKIPTLTYSEGIRELGLNSTPIRYPYLTNPCEGCPTYERIKNGETVIGDQCCWCSKNPNKITCGDTVETISINNVGTSTEVK